MTTDGTKCFYVNESLMFSTIVGWQAIEIKESGITTDYGDGFLAGWINLSVFGQEFLIEVSSIKYTSGGGF